MTATTTTTGESRYRLREGRRGAQGGRSKGRRVVPDPDIWTGQDRLLLLWRRQVTMVPLRAVDIESSMFYRTPLSVSDSPPISFRCSRSKRGSTSTVSRIRNDPREFRRLHVDEDALPISVAAFRRQCFRGWLLPCLCPNA